MNKIKLVVLYQVTMHYRLPFYNRIGLDEEISFTLLYGRGIPKTKLVNADLSKATFHNLQLYDYRIPLPFTPTLLYNLIKLNPDIVFSEGSSSLINSSIAFIYSKIFRKKFVWWSLGQLKNKKYKGFRKLINKWELFIERNSDSIFTYSSQGKEYFVSRGVDESKVFVAVNVFDTETKLKEINETFKKGFLNTDEFNIGFIGSIEKTKNLELLIDVVKSLNSQYGNIRLHIIGDGPYLPVLTTYSESLKEIVYHGRVNYGSSKILGNCDLFVLPGLGGLAICEAMLNKLPIITGNADGTEYDLVDERNGFILEDMNFESLYSKIDLLYNDHKLLLKMKEESFKKITEELGFENYYKIFKSMINYLVKI